MEIPDEERHMKPMTLCRVALGLALLGAAPASIALGADPRMDAANDPGRSSRWKALSEQIFGDRRIEPSQAMIKLDAPERAEDAALVPVTLAMTEKVAFDPANTLRFCGCVVIFGEAAAKPMRGASVKKANKQKIKFAPTFALIVVVKSLEKLRLVR